MPNRCEIKKKKGDWEKSRKKIFFVTFYCLKILEIFLVFQNFEIFLDTFYRTKVFEIFLVIFYCFDIIFSEFFHFTTK